MSWGTICAVCGRPGAVRAAQCAKCYIDVNRTLTFEAWHKRQREKNLAEFHSYYSTR